MHNRCTDHTAAQEATPTSRNAGSWLAAAAALSAAPATLQSSRSAAKEVK